MNEGVQALLHRAAIHDLHMRYFHGADSGDRALVRTCFTDDVHAQYEGRPPVQGLDGLIAQIALFENLANGSCRISTHFTGNVRFVHIGGDTAETHVNAFAFLVNEAGDAVSMRCLRYLDRLRLQDGQWKISQRFHTLDWRSDAPCAFARPFAQKVAGFPV